MAYVADTHSWVFYLLGKLPKKADEVFASVERGEDIMFVPTIVLAECIYLIEGGKILLSLENLFEKFQISGNFIPFSMNLEIVKELPKIKISEMHDRVIVATAELLKAKLVTKDKEISESGIVETVW